MYLYPVYKFYTVLKLCFVWCVEALDASRTWIVYWCMHGLHLLQEPLTADIIDDILDFLARSAANLYNNLFENIYIYICSTYFVHSRCDLVFKLIVLHSHLWAELFFICSRCQSKDGGFGGGPGQLPHLAPTYASINALVTIGTSQALALIDRWASLHKLWHS